MDVELFPLTQEHGKAIVRWLRDPVVSRNLGLRSVPTAAKTRAFIESTSENATICARTIYADGVHVGMLVLDQIDRQVEKARLHIYVGAATARGQGVGKKALLLALALAFEDLKLNKVWLTVHAKNPGAIAAYVATGFQVEGVQRDEFMLGSERVNQLYMGVLASEWHPETAPKRRGARKMQ